MKETVTEKEKEKEKEKETETGSESRIRPHIVVSPACQQEHALTGNVSLPPLAPTAIAPISLS